LKKILIADDHSIVRTGISVLIKAEFSAVHIDECSNGDSAWKKIQATPYDLFIMDINMPGTDSVNLLKNIFTLPRKTNVLVLTMSSEEIYARKYLQLGVMGFINKEADTNELRRAITSVINNRKYMSPALQALLSGEPTDEHTGNSPFINLSARELEVMTHLVKGRNVSEIAEILSIHISTASTHKANILQKLKVPNVIELTRIVNRFDIS
jgi:DNA-binding NarL/FixJ family response regulator